MTYLKSGEEEEGTREHESVSMLFTWTMILPSLYRMRRGRKGRARSREAHEGERLQGQNMYKSLYIVEGDK